MRFVCFFLKDYPHIIYIFVIAAFKKWIDICISFIFFSQENGSRSSWLSGQPSLALLARSDWRRRWQPRTYWACLEQCPGWPIKLWLRVSRVGDWWPRKTTEDIDEHTVNDMFDRKSVSCLRRIAESEDKVGRIKKSLLNVGKKWKKENGMNLSGQKCQNDWHMFQTCVRKLNQKDVPWCRGKPPIHF